MIQQPTSPAHPAVDVVLHLLRALSADMGEVKADIREIKERIGLLEGQFASASRRLNQLGNNVGRIKVHLDLHDEAVR